MLKQKKGKWCAYNEEGTRSFGCYDTKGEAEHRLGQMEMFKRMKENVTSLVVRVHKALGGGDYPGSMPKQLAAGLCKKFGGDPGFFTRCMASNLRLPEGYDKKGYCAELHKHCTGHWPAEKKQRKPCKGCTKMTLRTMKEKDD